MNIGTGIFSVCLDLCYGNQNSMATNYSQWFPSNEKSLAASTIFENENLHMRIDINIKENIFVYTRIDTCNAKSTFSCNALPNPTRKYIHIQQANFPMYKRAYEACALRRTHTHTSRQPVKGSLSAPRRQDAGRKRRRLSRENFVTKSEAKILCKSGCRILQGS